MLKMIHNSIEDLSTFKQCSQIQNEFNDRIDNYSRELTIKDFYIFYSISYPE